MMTSLAAFAVVAILLHPFLFLLHRVAVFRAVPFDDYAGFLLWLAGHPEGAFPLSPYCYRILSMAAALPLFHAVPALGLTNVPADTSAMWLRATLALNLLNYLAVVAAAVLVARWGQRRFGLLPTEAMLAGGLLFALAWFTQLAAVDGVALLLVAVGMTLLRRPLALCGLLLLATGTNEKVALVLALWLGVRVVLVPADRPELWLPFALAAAAVGLHLTAVAALGFPGHEYQTGLTGSLATVLENLRAYATPRGMMLNVLPIAVLGAVAGWAARAREGTLWFRAVDGLVVVALVLVALRFTQLYQVGRIVMHAAPLFVVPAVLALRRRPVLS